LRFGLGAHIGDEFREGRFRLPALGIIEEIPLSLIHPKIEMQDVPAFGGEYGRESLCHGEL
jgi:hypothetical protein